MLISKPPIENDYLSRILENQLNHFFSSPVNSKGTTNSDWFMWPKPPVLKWSMTSSNV